MRLVRIISYGLTVLGIALVAAGVAFDLSPAITLSGMLLIVAGVVKIVMLGIWQTMFKTPVALRDPEKPASPPARPGIR